MHDLIVDTAKKLGIVPKDLFLRASRSKGFSNAEEVGTYRFAQWFKNGIVPPFVKDWCLDQWRPNQEIGDVQPSPQHAA